MTKNIIDAALKETKDKKDLKNIHAVQLMKDEVPLIFVLGLRFVKFIKNYGMIIMSLIWIYSI